MRAAVYARVSTRDKGQDPENQLRELREYCARQDWPIHAEYVDLASGKSAQGREALGDLFADASRKKFDVVVVWALDRFTREGVARTFEHIERLSSYGVRFESFTEPQFRTTGAAGELMLAIAAWIAKQERERTRERVIAGVRHAQALGTKCGRPLKIWDRNVAADMRDRGESWRAISVKVGVSVPTLRLHLNSRQGPDVPVRGG